MKGIHDASHQECSPPDLVEDLPFQLQTQYTTTDGSTLLRVNTTKKPVTKERHIAEKGNVFFCHIAHSVFSTINIYAPIDIGMNVTVIGSHGLRTSAKFAQEGKFLEARAGAIISHNLLTRSEFGHLEYYIY